mgnify:CR=1 FL=1
MVSFLDEVRKVNKRYRAVLAVVGNFQSHKSKLIKEKAEEWDIYLVYLPPYSPDLNPIEYIWRSIKRVLSLAFVESLSEIKRITGDSWDEFSRRMGYAKSWVERFLKGKQYYMDLCG